MRDSNANMARILNTPLSTLRAIPSPILGMLRDARRAVGMLRDARVAVDMLRDARGNEHPNLAVALLIVVVIAR